MLNVLENGHNLESFRVQCPMSILNLERNKAKSMNVTLLKNKTKYFRLRLYDEVI